MFAPYACSNLNSINSLPALNAPDFQRVHIIGASIFLRALLFFLNSTNKVPLTVHNLVRTYVYGTYTDTPMTDPGLSLLLLRPISESKHQYGLSSHIVAATTANLVRGLPGGPPSAPGMPHWGSISALLRRVNYFPNPGHLNK